MPVGGWMSRWDDPTNAELYDAFARAHRLYRDTSSDLIDLAGIRGGMTVVDLACGTGVTTELILECLDDAGRVVAVDGSEAMLNVAQRNVSDPRVTWVKADGVAIADNVTDADAILCNSAFWQMDMEETLRACARALRPGGILAFNIGRNFLMMPLTPEELRPAKPTFFHMIEAVAVLDHGYAPPHPAATRGPRRRRGPLTPDSLKEMIVSAGLVVDAIEEREYENPADAQLGWISVPVFADNVLPGMAHEQQLDVIRSAYERFDKSTTKSKWFFYVARKTEAAGS